MKRPTLFSLAYVTTASLLCSGALAEATFKDTTRIVSIGGSITEIVYALGRQKDLVARDSTSVYPPETKALPDVGYMRQLSPEGVLSVNPTGILALEGSGPKEAIDVLKKTSVPYAEIPDTFTRDGILAKIRAVGAALDENAKADELANQVGRQLESAEALTSKIERRKRVLFILSMQGGKIMASGADTAADGILKLAGAVNAVDGFTGYKQLSDEAVITAKPDVILMMDRGGSHGMPLEQLFNHPAIAQTPAAADKRLVRMDGGFLLGFGPRTAQAVSDLARSLYYNEVAH